MRAIVFERHGGPEVLELRSLPEPVPGPQEVLIEVKASGVNPNGYWARVGVNGRAFPLPMIPGSDASGIVRAVGDHVNYVAVGDEVVVYCGVSCRKCFRCVNGEEHICEQNGGFKIWGFDTGPHQGAHAEWVTLHEHNCVPKPRGLSWEEAASLPLTLVTAWHMLVTNARIGANDVVLIRGAAGGLGVMATQICKLRGAVVIAVASNESKAELCHEMGADQVIIRPRTENGDDRAVTRACLADVKRLTNLYYRRGVDVVFDHVGGSTVMESIKALRHGGVMVTCGATSGYQTHVELANLFIQNKGILGSTLGSKAELIQALRCVERGQIKPRVTEVLPLEECGRAQELLRTGVATGKVVLGR
ncbi:MAG TPA: zinc-binding dehydrogenase [Candidatus Eisenbacteria bacterium]|jgi:crotonyl-CoA carboxylase/reductase